MCRAVDVILTPVSQKYAIKHSLAPRKHEMIKKWVQIPSNINNLWSVKQ